MEIFTSGWFNWIDSLPTWLQIIVGIGIYLICMSVIILSINGIKWCINKLSNIWNN